MSWATAGKEKGKIYQIENKLCEIIWNDLLAASLDLLEIHFAFAEFIKI